MFFDFFLGVVFIGSAGTIWYSISQKIPELVAVPDEVIVEHLHEDSARIRIFLLHFKTFWREGQYRAWLWKFCEKIFYRVHILLLRIDNNTVAFLAKIRAAGGLANGGLNGKGVGRSSNRAEKISRTETNSGGEYWLRIRGYEETKAAASKIDMRLTRPRQSRIQEVRMKNTEKTPEQIN